MTTASINDLTRSLVSWLLFSQYRVDDLCCHLQWQQLQPPSTMTTASIDDQTRSLVSWFLFFPIQGGQLALLPSMTTYAAAIDNENCIHWQQEEVSCVLVISSHYRADDLWFRLQWQHLQPPLTTTTAFVNDKKRSLVWCFFSAGWTTCAAAFNDNKRSCLWLQQLHPSMTRRIPLFLGYFFPNTGWMTCVAAFNYNNHSCLQQQQLHLSMTKQGFLCHAFPPIQGGLLALQPLTKTTAAIFNDNNSIHQQQEVVPCAVVIMILSIGWTTCTVAFDDNNHSHLWQ